MEGRDNVKHPVVCHSVAWFDRRLDWPPVSRLVLEGGEFTFCEGCQIQVIIAPASQEKIRKGEGYPICWECHGPDLANAIQNGELIAFEGTSMGFQRLATHTGLPGQRRK